METKREGEALELWIMVALTGAGELMERSRRVEIRCRASVLSAGEAGYEAIHRLKTPRKLRSILDPRSPFHKCNFLCLPGTLVANAAPGSRQVHG